MSAWPQAIVPLNPRRPKNDNSCNDLIRPSRRFIAAPRRIWWICFRIKDSACGLQARARNTASLAYAGGRESSWFLGIDQDEGDAAGLGSAVDPGMVGPLLHHHVADLEMHFGVVEQHIDLAL